MQSKRLKKPATLLILGLTVAGCSQTTATGVTSVACSAFPPITWSVKDTPPTIKQVKAHNSARTAVCKQER